MNLYLLERPEENTWYDQMCSCVVAAKYPKQARDIASLHTGDETRATWLKSKGSTCRKIGVAGRNVKSGMICRNFLGS